PIVMSDIPVFREITQNQGAYFSPGSAEAIAAAVESTLGSSSRRGDLIAYGRQRVQAFRFESIAEQLAALYLDAV
ncbi:MAG: hypothetical protein VW257_02810, partial [Quisquiliibacterium sp.]